jgi:Tc5 transposase-like DNA-binding protein
MESEARIQEALQALENKDFNTLYAAAKHYDVSRATLTRRASGSKSRAQGQESAQLLSMAEEKALVKWISQLSSTGKPVRHALVKEMAEEIRLRRVRHVNDASIQLVQYPPIGKEWIQRFLKRHPLLLTTTARQTESSRLREATFEALFRWFNAVETKFAEQKYDICNVYNVDESGFGIGTSQANRVIVDSSQRTCWKAIPGRQEWVSAIECISADGAFLPPLLIF